MNEKIEELTNEHDHGSEHTHRLWLLSACRGLGHAVTFRWWKEWTMELRCRAK